jgi:ABC-type uncharacterized transport system permease subunit
MKPDPVKNVVSHRKHTYQISMIATLIVTLIGMIAAVAVIDVIATDVTVTVIGVTVIMTTVPLASGVVAVVATRMMTIGAHIDI